ncbi:hypothetical protein FGG08_001026 [Glutinoglossum americanum]|uniref:Calcineurin-like phosphoesterase domain-containing protein n=1 Tax=Glutinoglossum americanum TaxID=1670608 RepID=A0A9P8L6G2_9PEZI|nr:hypothetical protein FGG08_001026 [Glutinoglossum americanum]
MDTTSAIATSSTVTTRFLILSDTHTATPAPHTFTSLAFRLPLPRVDVLLHAGDLTMSGRLAEYSSVISFLASTPAELKLVIAGNHDMTLDAEYYEKNRERQRLGGEGDAAEAKKMWTGEAAQKAGIVYLEEGIRTFTLMNGARFTVCPISPPLAVSASSLLTNMSATSQIYTSPYQPEFLNWAFNYPHDQDRFNPPSPNHPNPHPPAITPIPSFPTIDIVMTHGPPYNILDETNRDINVGCPHLLRAVSRARPRLHCFGHIHEGWGAERVRWEEPKEGEAGCVEGEWKIGDETLWGEKREETSEEALREGAACWNLGKESEKPLEWGRETLFVNASVMTRRYRPNQPPWRIDLELPLAGQVEAESGLGENAREREIVGRYRTVT